MNRIEFVGNALFIPFFLISVGMLVDVTVLVKGWGALRVAGVIVLVAIATKWIAARITQKAFKLSTEEGNLIFGLSTSHAAATLAIILVGYNIIIGETPSGEPIRLLNEDVLNGTILLILISCAVGSFVVERNARKLALQEEATIPENIGAPQHKILISLAYPDSVTELVDLGLMLKTKKNTAPVYALHVVGDEEVDSTESSGKKMLEKAVRQASATENLLQPISRYDANISNGIIYTVKEQNITDLIIGLHQNANTKDFLGATANHIVKRVYETIFIYKSIQPLNTTKRIVVAVSPKAELEPGFAHWFFRLVTLAKETGTSLAFYATPQSIVELQSQQQSMADSVPITYHGFVNWDDFLILHSMLKPNDLFVIITSRKDSVSYHPILEKLPYYLVNYFKTTSYMIIYPQQLERGVNMENLEAADGSLAETISENVLRKPGNLIKKLFKK